MKGALPGPGVKNRVKRKFWLKAFEVLVALIGVISLATTLLRTYRSGKFGWADTAVLASAMALIWKVGCDLLDAKDEIAEAVKELPANEFSAALDLGLEVINAILNPNSDRTIRLFLWRAIPPSRPGLEVEFVEQITKCHGGKSRGKVGRRHRASCGAVGQALQSGEPVFQVRTLDDVHAHRRSFLQNGMNRKEARGINENVWSWAAVPLAGVASSDGADEEVPVAVLFADSTDVCFGDENAQLAITLVANGINRYIRRKYLKEEQ